RLRGGSRLRCRGRFAGPGLPLALEFELLLLQLELLAAQFEALLLDGQALLLHRQVVPAADRRPRLVVGRWGLHRCSHGCGGGAGVAAAARGAPAVSVMAGQHPALLTPLAAAIWVLPQEPGTSTRHQSPPDWARAVFTGSRKRTQDTADS